MSEKNPTSLIKHPFEVHAAQAVEDVKAMEEGFFTPDIYFTNGPNGLWAANNLRRYIVKMGYEAEIALDPLETDRHGFCQHLKVGRIPQSFLEDIKDYMAIEEISKKKAHYCVYMEENGNFKTSAETTMWHAFQGLKNNNGGSKSRPKP